MPRVDPAPDPELEELFRAARERALDILADLRRINRDNLPPDAQAAYDRSVEQMQMLIRLTSAEALSAIRDAVAVAGRELSADEVIGVLLPPH